MEDLGWESMKGEGRRGKGHPASESHDACKHLSTGGRPGKDFTAPSLGPPDARLTVVLKTPVLLAERGSASGLSLSCANARANGAERQASP